MFWTLIISLHAPSFLPFVHVRIVKCDSVAEDSTVIGMWALAAACTFDWLNEIMSAEADPDGFQLPSSSAPRQILFFMCSEIPQRSAASRAADIHKLLIDIQRL